jgi:hypothetical protein
MISLTLGVVLLAATIGLFLWGIPKNGQPSRIPDKWGLGAAFPILVMSMGIVGLIFAIKGIFP